ncbi:MAG TPA: C-GCAxxG-C-C family protein [Bacteroidales bacterium]|nr:C-GCAxxG-C-C family protein [Bacteroidales bacterium]
MTKQETIDKAISFFEEGYACSQAVVLAFAPQFNIDETAAKLISSTFGGGMGRLREKCGAVTGGFMVLGLAYGNTDPKDMDTKLAAYQKVRDINQLVIDKYGTTMCSDILKQNVSENDVKQRNHHAIICYKVVGDVAGMVYDMLNKK